MASSFDPHDGNRWEKGTVAVGGTQLTQLRDCRCFVVPRPKGKRDPVRVKAESQDHGEPLQNFRHGKTPSQFFRRIALSVPWEMIRGGKGETKTS